MPPASYSPAPVPVGAWGKHSQTPQALPPQVVMPCGMQMGDPQPYTDAPMRYARGCRCTQLSEVSTTGHASTVCTVPSDLGNAEQEGDL